MSETVISTDAKRNAARVEIDGSTVAMTLCSNFVLRQRLADGEVLGRRSLTIWSSYSAVAPR